jgi:hypothetical protein
MAAIAVCYNILKAQPCCSSAREGFFAAASPDSALAQADLPWKHSCQVVSTGEDAGQVRVHQIKHMVLHLNRRSAGR